MSYEITTGDAFFYGGLGTDFGMVHGVIEMKDPVDRDDLQRAVDTAMPRFPYFCTRAVVEDGRYVLKPNDAPFVVYEQEEPIPPGDDRLNGYLITFGCWGNKLYSDNFHGMGDGRGTVAVVQSVLYYYCLYHYGEPINCPGVMLAEETPDPEEYADPLSYAPPIPEGFIPPAPVRYFSIPEERVGPEEPHTLYTISMNQKDFVRYTKSVDGSPAVMAALFLCRAIDEVHPEHDRPIAVSMPVDVRAMLGCEKTRQNCVQPIDLVYSERIKAMPLERQATCFRGMVFVKSDPDQMLPLISLRAASTQEMKKIKDPEAFRDVLMASGDLFSTPIASYMGTMDYGDVEKYRTNFMSTGDARFSGLTLNVFTAGDTITFNMQYALKSDVYFKAMIHQLLEAGITLVINPPVRYMPMKRLF